MTSRLNYTIQKAKRDRAISIKVNRTKRGLLRWNKHRDWKVVGCGSIDPFRPSVLSNPFVNWEPKVEK